MMLNMSSINTDTGIVTRYANAGDSGLAYRKQKRFTTASDVRLPVLSPRAGDFVYRGIAMDNEEWRSIVGYEGLYEVSNLGSIRSKKTGKQLTGRNSKGYRRVHLRNNGKNAHPFVHRLVASAFIGPCPDGYQTNHKNAVRDDNRAVNLEWVTSLENIRDMMTRGKYDFHLRPMPGERNPNAKLTKAAVEDIRANCHRGMHKIFEQKYGVTASTLRNVLRRNTWRES
jgi:hypothetical protein